MSDDEETLEDILKLTDFKFQIIFQGTPQARTTSISSAVLKAAAGKRKIWDATLETVRDCGKLPKAYLFCVNGTNTVADSTDLGHYISLTEDNITALQNAAPGTSAILTVQYTSRYRPPPTEIPKPPTLTTSPNDEGKIPEISDKDKAPVAVSIDTTGLVVGSDNVSSTHPAEMTDKEWNYVMTTNSLLHGMFYDTTSETFQNARNPAFKLKASVPDPSPETKGDQICTPTFEVNDESSVTITEVKSTYQLSMARHAFNSSSVEASASGGYGGVSGGVSASASWSSSHSSASSKAEDMDCLHGSYNFPRVKVFLDSDDLEITDDCKELLETIKQDTKPDDIAKFYRKYGHIFAGSVQLGGRLHTTKESKACKEASTEEKKDAFKVAAAASISSAYGSGSASAAHGSNSESNSNTTSGQGSESLAWEAQGGETLLASNPPAWITTVGSFCNWRVIERRNVHDILALLKNISNEDWPTIFNHIDVQATAAKDRLVFIGPLQRDHIEIVNVGSTKVRVAVSTSLLSRDESSSFFEIDSNASKKWKRYGSECVFINDVGSDRVAIAMAQPGLHEINSVQPTPADSYSNDEGNISVKNSTANTILVNVTLSGKPKSFHAIFPGRVLQWTRTESETIFVKHLSSNALLTYFGISSKRLRVGEPSLSSLPNFLSVPDDSLNSDTINVSNEQLCPINVVYSFATDDKGWEGPFTIDPEGHHGLARSETEVVYVNGPHGTAVGAYFGIPGNTLIADKQIS